MAFNCFACDLPAHGGFAGQAGGRSAPERNPERPIPKFQPGHIAAGNGNAFGKFGLRQPKRLANFTNPFVNGHSNDSFRQ